MPSATTRDTFRGHRPGRTLPTRSIGTGSSPPESIGVVCGASAKSPTSTCSSAADAAPCPRAPSRRATSTMQRARRKRHCVAAAEAQRAHARHARPAELVMTWSARRQAHAAGSSCQYTQNSCQRQRQNGFLSCVRKAGQCCVTSGGSVHTAHFTTTPSPICGAIKT